MRTYALFRQCAKALFVAALLLSPLAAHAQALGGAGGAGGLIGPAITWFMTNLANGLIMIGVLCVGGMLLFMRLYIAGIAMMVCGALIISNYSTIATAVATATGIGG